MENNAFNTNNATWPTQICLLFPTKPVMLSTKPNLNYWSNTLWVSQSEYHSRHLNKHLVQESSYHYPNISSPKSLMLKGSYCTYQERGRGVFQTHQTTHVMFCTELDLDVQIHAQEEKWICNKSINVHPKIPSLPKKIIKG